MRGLGRYGRGGRGGLRRGWNQGSGVLWGGAIVTGIVVLILILILILPETLGGWSPRRARFRLCGSKGPELRVFQVDFHLRHMSLHFRRHIFLPRLGGVAGREIDWANIDFHRVFWKIQPGVRRLLLGIKVRNKIVLPIFCRVF